MHNGFCIYVGKGGGEYVCSTGDDCHLFPLFLFFFLSFFPIGKWTRQFMYSTYKNEKRKREMKSTLRSTV